MKIKLSKSQWKQIGKTAGWYSDLPEDPGFNSTSEMLQQELERRKNENSPEIDPETGVSKETFMKYVKIQLGGKYNMIINGDIVMKLLGVDKQTYMNILQNYDKLIAKWPEAENT